MGREKRIQGVGHAFMICNILGCNAECFAKLMYCYAHSNSQKPSCKEIMQVCKNHGREIASKDVNVRIQTLL